MPAVPVDIAGVLDSLVMLGIRAQQGEQAYQSITKAFTIGHFAAWRSQRSSPRRYGRRSAHRVDPDKPRTGGGDVDSHGLQLLDGRAGPPVGDDARQRVLMYRLIARTALSGARVFEITVLDPRPRAYGFTFG
jgi:hypothetical protein